MRVSMVRHEEFVYCDPGSGLGRTLFMASEYPFKADLVARVLANHKRSLEETPRKAFLLNYNPLSGHVVDSLNFLNYAKDIPFRYEITRTIQRKAKAYANFKW